MRALVLLASASILSAQLPGRRLFESQCVLCHGQNGGGGRGPSLLKPKLDKAPDDNALEGVISNGISPEMPGAWQLNPNEVQQLAAYVRTLGSIAPEVVPGDSTNGRDIYQKSNCASCHIVAGIGSGFGPELTSIGLRRNAAHLRESIVNPAASLPEGFLLVEAVPLNGAPFKGIRLNEDPFNVTVASVGGQLRVFRKAELKRLEQFPKTSPMPAYNSFAPSDLQDLVAYLASLKGSNK